MSNLESFINTITETVLPYEVKLVSRMFEEGCGDNPISGDEIARQRARRGVPTRTIIDGIAYERTFVTELEHGDCTVFGEVVDFIQRIGDEGKTRVYMTNGQTTVFGDPRSTLLILAGE